MILAIDRGRRGRRAWSSMPNFACAGRGYCELAQHFPQPVWVEHDPEEIWATVLGASEDALGAAGVHARELTAIGIASQRATTPEKAAALESHLIGGTALCRPERTSDDLSTPKAPSRAG